MPSIRVAAAQIDVVLGDVLRNLSTVLASMAEAARQGARLVVFPECALSGYCFTDAGEARRAAQTVPGPATDSIAEACRKLDLVAVVGMVECEESRLYNTAAVVGPSGLIGRYRKTHLPFLGLDRFVTAGEGPLTPFETPAGKLGVMICYDGSFPEAARVLKLKGAQILALPTNWPEAATVASGYQPIVRAHENHVHFVAVNRVGRERAFRFIGQSKIVECSAKVLAGAGSDAPELLLADLDPAASDMSRIVYVRGEYEIDRVAHRRPELYGPIVEPCR